MPRARNILAGIAVTVSVWGHAVASEGSDAAIQVVRGQATGCAGCYFFSWSIDDPLIRKYDLAFVSTLDRVPSPVWAVALPKGGDPILLDALHPTGWNRLIVVERPSLKTHDDFETYAKGFARLAAGNSSFLSQLLPAELARVKKKAAGATLTSLAVVRGKERISVSFYVRSADSTIVLWDLLLEPDGAVIKAESRRF
ncbi:MAG: hypothetical protein V1495_07725 [Pseudomonadota bacterium]